MKKLFPYGNSRRTAAKQEEGAEKFATSRRPSSAASVPSQALLCSPPPLPALAARRWQAKASFPATMRGAFAALAIGACAALAAARYDTAFKGYSSDKLNVHLISHTHGAGARRAARGKCSAAAIPPTAPPRR